MSDAVYVGIDVSKETLQVAVAPSGDEWTSRQSPGALDALLVRLQALQPMTIVIEATGGYERAVVAACAAAGLPVAVVNPRQVRAPCWPNSLSWATWIGAPWRRSSASRRSIATVATGGAGA